MWLTCSDGSCDADVSNSFPTLLQVSEAAGVSNGRTVHTSDSTALVRPAVTSSGARVDSPSDPAPQQTAVDGVPAALTSTLQHIVAQLDVLTQVTPKHSLHNLTDGPIRLNLFSQSDSKMSLKD